ncbi:hypothetical protein MD484_g5289, partial [Candolleomyces efflorescens]
MTASIQDVVTVPVVVWRGERPPSIPLIGIIGSRHNGKSTFLKELAISIHGDASLDPSFKLNAFISEYDITIPGPYKKAFTLVDLPAFEDNDIDNHASALKAMVAYLGEQYQKGRPLSSLIWCYDISKPRFTVVDEENLNLVKDISGPNALRSVTVITTGWNKSEVVGAPDAVNPQTVAEVETTLQGFIKTESLLKSLFEGVPESNWKRFGLFSDPVAQEMALSSGNPLELLRSLPSNKKGFQVQPEACGTRILAGTTAGRTLQRKLGEAIKRKGKDLWDLVEQLDELDDDGVAEQIAMQQEKEDAEQDILRWKATLEEIELINSAFSH